ncbi:MAG: hypothetical protein JXB88_12225 [Spirochaetales bacterium]|nr:hypothetical protein [Spirochaetales bacterium]
MHEKLYKINVMVILIVIISYLFIVTGCSHYSSILFIYKNYSYEILESNPKTKKNIKKNCKENGYNSQFVVITRKGEESIIDIINTSDASLIYLDPLIRESPGNIAKKYINKLFFTLKREYGKIKPPNLLTINFDRRETFRQAGVLTGKLLAKGLSKEQDAVKDKKAGMIIYPASTEVQNESSEFINGFSTVQPEDRFVYREVTNLEDKVQIKSIMDEMINNGVIIFFFKLYFQDTYGLDYLKKQGIYTIVENWNFNSGYENMVLFTIEDDFSMSLLELFQNIRIREDGSSEWKKKEIKGKIEIKWGNVIESPE